MLDGAPVPGAEDAEANLARIVVLATELGVDPARIKIDRTLARGLDYYTGPVFETVLPEGNIGSISGGGRYDGLIGMFSGTDVPAVGVSLGLERVIVLMEERGMFPDIDAAIDVFVTVFDEDHRAPALAAARALRDAGQRVEVSYTAGKLAKQLKLADRRGAHWVITIGPDEHASGAVQLKDMRSGDRRSLPLADAVTRITDQA